MARLERYVDNVIGSDSYDGTSPVRIPETSIGPWLTTNKACVTDPGSGNYFAVYLKNNNNLSSMVIRPYRRTATYMFEPRYSGLDLDTPMEFHLDGAWMSSCLQVSGTWEKVPGTSYIYRLHLPAVSTLYSIWAYGGDSVRGTLPGPVRWLSLSNVPLDSQNHSYYWDGTSRYLYICDWSGNPNATGLYIEMGDEDRPIRMFSSSIKFHRFINGIFYGCKNSMTSGQIYEGLSIERCLIYGDSGFDYGVRLPLNSRLIYSVVIGRGTAHANNAVVYIAGTGNKIYNNLLLGSSYGVRLANGAGAEVYNNICLGQNVRAFMFDGAYNLTSGYNAFGTLEFDNYYGNCIGKLPETTDIYTFPGQQYGIFDKVFRYDGSNYTDVTSAAANDDASDFDLMGSSSHYIYFGGSEPFMGLLFSLSTNGNYAGLSWQYYRGDSGWGSFHNLRGETGFSVAQGTVAFTMPHNWVKTSINGSEPLYWIRVRAGTVTTMGVCKYARINGSLWEYFCRDRDAYDLRPVNKDIIGSRGHDWGYRDLDLIGNSVKRINIGPYAILGTGRSGNYIEIEI